MVWTNGFIAMVNLRRPSIRLVPSEEVSVAIPRRLRLMVVAVGQIVPVAIEFMISDMGVTGCALS